MPFLSILFRAFSVFCGSLAFNSGLIYITRTETQILSFWQNYFSFCFKKEAFSEKCAEINEKFSIKISMNFSDQPRKNGKLRKRITDDQQNQ